jgi:hypothetical protein
MIAVGSLPLSGNLLPYCARFLAVSTGCGSDSLLSQFPCFIKMTKIRRRIGCKGKRKAFFRLASKPLLLFLH